MPPILRNKHPTAPSVFTVEALLRHARRQKNMRETCVPRVCILDPDGDIVAMLRRTGRSTRFSDWPCYHSDLDTFLLGEETVGIVGRAVGAPFAVLIAEEMFASGCELLLSITSAGQITPAGPLPHFIVINKALRDEGTSYHYQPPADYAEADPQLVRQATAALSTTNARFVVGSSWTTDAPFRENEAAIQWARSEGILAVEMEAAALYAFAASYGKAVLCIAHVTNTMGQSEEDFEKGTGDGSEDALAVLGSLVATSLRRFAEG